MPRIERNIEMNRLEKLLLYEIHAPYQFSAIRCFKVDEFSYAIDQTQISPATTQLIRLD